jgi:D-alanine-D-alanine ligase-like ATP-grasp enzyme
MDVVLLPDTLLKVPETFPSQDKFVFVVLPDCAGDALRMITKLALKTRVFINLYDKSNECGQAIVNFLHKSNYAYTGVEPHFYDPTRDIIKTVCLYNGIQTPSFAFIRDLDDPIVNPLTDTPLKYPLFVKPEKGYDSVGIDEKSLVQSPDDLRPKLKQIVDRFGGALVEEYVDGREFSVLVAGKWDLEVRSFCPVEYIFKDTLFLTEQLKATAVVDYWYEPLKDHTLAERIKQIAETIFCEFYLTGYIRIDLRMERDTLYVLDVNPYCSLFMSNSLNECSTADKILHYSGVSSKEFLEYLIELALARKDALRKKYTVKHNAASGFHIVASQDIRAQETIYNLEFTPHTLISKAGMLKYPRLESTFKRYCYPLTKDVYVAWDRDPHEWKPINHSCDPNSREENLTLIATRDIKKGEQITIDYSTFVESRFAETFECRCGAKKCRSNA